MAEPWIPTATGDILMDFREPDTLVGWNEDGSPIFEKGGSVQVRAMTETERADYELNRNENQWARDLMYEELNLCGCADDASYELIRDVLRLMPLYKKKRLKKCRALIGNEGAFHLILGAMSDATLITHGGNVTDSWLERDGKRLLAVLNDVDDWRSFRNQ